MTTDKKEWLEYDYTNYIDKYNELEKGIKNNQKVDNLDIKDMKLWQKQGIFCRKLKFQNIEENFYITISSISRGEGYYHDFKFNNDYIISHVRDKKGLAKKLMELEIGEEYGKNGKLELVGNFKPINDNLINIEYQTKLGKEFISDAKLFLSGKENIHTDKIDIDNFFRLQFQLAQQGIQAKALYDTQNSIIDGAAGTGKSTIAIEKLKYFYENKNIKQDELLIIVKNYNLKKYFATLLNDEIINLPDVKIKLFDEMVKNKDVINNLDLYIQQAKEIEKNINEFINKRDYKTFEEHYKNLFEFIGKEFFKKELSEIIEKNDFEKDKKLFESLKIKIENIKIKKEKYINDRKDYIKEIKNDKNKLLKSDNFDETSFYIMKWHKRKQNLNLSDFQYHLNNFSGILTKDTKIEIELIDEEITKFNYAIKKFDREIEETNIKISSLEKTIKQNQFNKNQATNLLEKLDKNIILPFNVIETIIQSDNDKKDSLEVLKWILEYRNFLLNKENVKKRIEKNDNPKEIEVLEKHLNGKFKKDTTEYIQKYKNVMKKVYFSKKFLEKNYSIIDDIIYKILNIDKKFNTIIVDEAQDFSNLELEFIRLHTNRIILTGDILQNINNDFGLSDWNDLLNKEYYFDEHKNLNIFKLKHNFRQTYQLANSSYNFRQLLLNQEMEDIGFDYYENEKYFNDNPYPLPNLHLLDTNLKIMNFIDEKLNHILKTYTKTFPIILVYLDEIEKNYYQDTLKDYSISINKNDLSTDILLLNINEIKGEQYPIVMANIQSFSNRELYLIMTRAQFELELFMKSYENFNHIIYNLIHNDKDLKFIELNDIDITKIKKAPKKNLNKIEDIKPKIKKEKITPKIKTGTEQIKAHHHTHKNREDELETEIITDKEKFAKTETKKTPSKTITSTYTIKAGKEETKEFLKKIYKGYCQICGFTFTMSNNENYFEMFHWSDKRKIKQKVNTLTKGNSLCLCAKCYSILKNNGDFEALFLNKVDNKYNFDEFIENVVNKEYDKIPEIFENNVEFDEVYPLEIRLNNQKENIYFTETHLLKFFEFLKQDK